jgi:hypothetical protein
MRLDGRSRGKMPLVATMVDVCFPRIRDIRPNVCFRSRADWGIYFLLARCLSCFLNVRSLTAATKRVICGLLNAQRPAGNQVIYQSD